MPWVALLRRHPAFARLMLSEAISLAGDWFSLVAISVLAVEQGGGQGAWAVAVTLAAHELPMSLMRPIAGVLADRFDRRNLLIGVHLAQAVMTLWMAERALAGDLPGLQALVVARSLMSGLDWPARAGAIRRLVSDDDLLTAHAMSGAVWSSMYAFGMAMGGLVSAWGVPQALLVDAGSFVFGALVLMTLPAMPTKGDGSLSEAARRAVSDLREAARLASRSSGLLLAVASKTPMSLAGGAGVVVLNLVAHATAFAGSGAASLGLLQAFRGIGTGFGPVIAERLVAGGFRLERVWAAVVAMGFVGVAAMALLPGPWWALLAAALVWGVGTGSNWMISSAELQRRAPDAAIGRLSGLDMLMAEFAFALSALGGGALIEAVGSWPVGAALGVGAGAAAWLGLQLAARAVASEPR